LGVNDNLLCKERIKAPVAESELRMNDNENLLLKERMKALEDELARSKTVYNSGNNNNNNFSNFASNNMMMYGRNDVSRNKSMMMAYAENLKQNY
jgi:hypothetical protein